MGTLTATGTLVRQSAEEYHSDTRRCSRSQLVDFICSSNLYYRRHVERDPDWQQDETEDMRFGTRFHAIALEGRRYEDTVNLIPEHVLSDSGDRRGKAYQLWASITPDADSYRKPKECEAERKQVESMMKSLDSSPAAVALLGSPGHPILEGKSPVEVGIHWAFNGIEMRTRLDRLNADCILDLKTARSCDLDSINNSLERDRYAIQAAFYTMAVEQLTGETLPFRFLFSEKSTPFRTVVVEMDTAWIDAAREEVEAALVRLQRCSDNDDWRDPIGDAVIPMSRPKWAAWKWQLTETEA